MNIQRPLTIFAIVAGAILFVGVIGAVSSGIHNPNSPIVETGCTRPDEGDLSTHDCYINRDGDAVHRPTYDHKNAPPAVDTALCSDGTYSFSRHARGTCSHHGGVQRWD